MIQWQKHKDKIAVKYKEGALSYQSLFENCKKLIALEINPNGVVICRSEDPLEQLYHVVYGLHKEMPVFLASEARDDTLGEGHILTDVFLIATSSGTSGREKYLYKRKEQWFDSFDSYGKCLGIEAHDILFINGSLKYTANLFSVLQMLYIGGTVVLSNDRNSKKWIQTIEEHHCTIGFLVPSKLRLLSMAASAYWGHKIDITTAGEAITEKILKTLAQSCPNLKIHHYYGAAEIGQVSFIKYETLLKRPKSVGRTFPEVSIKIEEGVIYAKSPYAATRGRKYESAYDCGYISDDGYLYIKGRRDTQVNRHGRKFDAELVRSYVNDLKHVVDCRLIIATNGKSYGLYILCDNNYNSDIKNYVGKQVECAFPSWQWPIAYRFVSEAIYSESGKYDMVKIKALFTEFE